MPKLTRSIILNWLTDQVESGNEHDKLVAVTLANYIQALEEQIHPVHSSQLTNLFDASIYKEDKTS